MQGTRERDGGKIGEAKEEMMAGEEGREGKKGRMTEGRKGGRRKRRRKDDRRWEKGNMDIE